MRRAAAILLLALAWALPPTSAPASGTAPHGDVITRGGEIESTRVATRDHDPENEPSYPPETGPRRVLVLMAGTASEADRRWPADRVEELVFGSGLSVAEHVAGQSRGRATVEGEVRGWYTIDGEVEGCGEYETARDALAAARADGVNIRDYHYVMVMFPRRSACGYNGMAEIGGPFSYINGLPPDFRLLAHEFGHNLGLYHAWAHTCSEDGRETALTGECGFRDYGDPFDVMGHAQRAYFSGFYRARLGWIRPEEVVASDDEGDYELRSVNDVASGPKLLQVEWPGDDGYDPRLGPRYLSVELRSPSPPFDDFAPGEPIVNGLTVRLTLGLDWTWPSRLVDVTPGSAGGLGDATIGVGQSFTDPHSGARFTLESLAGGVGRVRLAYPPTAPGGVRAELVGTDGAALAWAASTDAKGVAAYEVERDGAVVARTTALEAADGGLPPGATVTYRVVAVDGDGNRTASEPATVTTPPAPVVAPSADPAPPPPPPPPVARDTTRPRMRVFPRIGPRGRRLPRSRRLTLLVSDDRPGVRFTATLDGRLLRPAAAPRVVLRLPRRAARRGHVLTLVATDAAGNRRVVRLRIVRGRLLPRAR